MTEFPNALVPHATSVNDVISSWKNAGLKPVEVSEEDTTATINITSKRHKGELNWSVDKSDGINTLALMSITMRDMFKEYLQDGGRHKLATNTPDTKVAINLENNEVKMVYNHNQAMSVKGVLMACLWKLLEDTEKEGHPLDKFTGLLKFKVKK
jgi:hypothetical protein